MGLFDIFKKPSFKDDDIVAIAEGELINASEINDPIFSQEMMGKTIGIKINDNTIVSPVNGKLSMVYPSGHAFGIVQENGRSILVHIGIDTVELNGKYFKVLRKQGDIVKAGEPIVKIDKDSIEKSGYDTTSMIIITDPIGNESFIENKHVTESEIISK